MFVPSIVWPIPQRDIVACRLFSIAPYLPEGLLESLAFRRQVVSAKHPAHIERADGSRVPRYGPEEPVANRYGGDGVFAASLPLALLVFGHSS